MKIFISVDIEGITNVVNTESTGKKGYLYDSAREQMTAEVNAAIKGSFAAGATEVIVNDSHGGMFNLKPAKLHKDAKVILGKPKPLVMMQGVDEDITAAIFVGYHSRNNSMGILSHTISGGTVDNIWVNDFLLGETGINAAIAGYFGVPVVMVTGDNVVAEEATDLLGDGLTTVEVKKAISRYCAMCVHPEKALELIEAGAKKAVQNLAACSPLTFEGPVTGKLQFLNSGLADKGAQIPGAKRESGDIVSFTSDNYLDTFKALRTMISMAHS